MDCRSAISTYKLWWIQHSYHKLFL